jgi:hypothetical protein
MFPNPCGGSAVVPCVFFERLFGILRLRSHPAFESGRVGSSLARRACMSGGQLAKHAWLIKKKKAKHTPLCPHTTTTTGRAPPPAYAVGANIAKKPAAAGPLRPCRL